MTRDFTFSLPVKALSRTAKIIVIARSLTTFGHGFLAILLGIYLADIGFSLVQVGLFFSIGVSGGALFAFLVGILADRVGRRKILICLTLLTAMSVGLLIWAEHFYVFLILAFIGNLNGVGAGGSGQALQPIEQASLSDSAPADLRTEIFALYRIVGTSFAALGALTAGLPRVYVEIFGVSDLSAIKMMFMFFSILLCLGAFTYSFLSREIEVKYSSARWTNPFTLPSRKTIFPLVGLFSLDHFAGSLIIQGLVAYWFKANFGLEVDSLAFIFFLAQILSALSLWASAKISNRIGRINTMVFTHAPANIFLLGMAFAPNVWVAIFFWQLRSLLGSMDVPPRDSYIMSVVNEEERVAMAGMHIVGRSLSGTLGPSVGTALWQGVSAGAPFVACCAIRMIYDATLYIMFSKVVPKDSKK